MAINEDRYDQHVKRHINGWCTECDDSRSLRPGPLNDDKTIEYRTCEEGHTVLSEPLFYCAPGEATEFFD